MAMLQLRRKRRWLRRMGLGLLLLVVVLATLAFWPTGPIVPGPDTTVLTGPLNPDGTVNYVAALDETYRQGVTADNNAVVLLLRAFGPEFLPAEVRDKTLAALDVDPPPAGQQVFVPLDRMSPDGPVAAKAPGLWTNALRNQLTEAGRRPWTEQEFPALAKWIRLNEKPAELLVEATRSPRLYVPLVSPRDPPVLMDVLLASWSHYLETARFLVARAMLRAAADPDTAWQDIMATYRLARLVGQHPSLVGQMVAVTIDGLASTAAQALGTHGKLSSARARAMAAEVSNLLPPSNVISAIDKSERFLVLDAVSQLSHGRLDMKSLSGTEASSVPSWLRLLRVDWNKVLRLVNRSYNGWVADLTGQPRANSAAKDDLDLEGSPKKHIWRGPSYVVACTVVHVMAPAVGLARQTERKARMTRSLTALALVLAAWKAEKGDYPDALQSLAPGYLKAVPNDLFTDKPLVYRRTADGYLLHSVGPNLADDGGRTDRDAPGCDDLVIKVEAAAAGR